MLVMPIIPNTQKNCLLESINFIEIGSKKTHARVGNGMDERWLDKTRGRTFSSRAPRAGLSQRHACRPIYGPTFKRRSLRSQPLAN